MNEIGRRVMILQVKTVRCLQRICKIFWTSELMSSENIYVRPRVSWPFKNCLRGAERGTKITCLFFLCEHRNKDITFVLIQAFLAKNESLIKKIQNTFLF